MSTLRTPNVFTVSQNAASDLGSFEMLIVMRPDGQVDIGRKKSTRVAVANENAPAGADLYEADTQEPVGYAAMANKAEPRDKEQIVTALGNQPLDRNRTVTMIWEPSPASGCMYINGVRICW